MSTAPSPRKLHTRFDIFAWYESVRASGRPVAWCSAFAPAEVLLACGVIPVYPENHAAMLGALSPTRDPANPWSGDAISAAEAAGHLGPKLCSYAQADIGVLLGAGSPIAGLPPPDLFYSCDSQCSVVARWGDAVAGIEAGQGRDIPHYLLQAVPLRSDAYVPGQLSGFRAQLRQHVDDICARFGTRFDEAYFAKIVAMSDTANRLWQDCLELARQKPSPWTNTDAFQAMAPIVIARGSELCIDYYRELHQELTARVNSHSHAIANERIRLLWDAIPIWPRKNWLASTCAALDAAFVCSTYTHSWWFQFDLDQPWESVTERYAWNTMNRSGAWVLDWTKDLVRDYQIDGIVCHWNRSCGIWNSYVKRRLPGYRDAGIPHLVIEADMVDPRAFDEARISNQLQEFIGQLGSRPCPA